MRKKSIPAWGMNPNSRNGFKKGYIVTEETRKKLREHHCSKTEFKKGHKSYYGLLGKHQTKEAKEKVRKYQLAHPSLGIFKKNHIVTKEMREKLSIANKGKKMSEISRRKMSITRLKQVLPTKDTSIELKLANELSNREYGFYMHYPIKGQPDLCFPDKKIAIFADGDYWHNRKGSKERDKKVNDQLQKEGWLVLRYWEHEINNDVTKCVDEIEKIIEA